MGGWRRIAQPPIGWWFKHVARLARQIPLAVTVRCDEESLKAHKLSVSLLPRKASKRVVLIARTVNRHRWVGRVFQGVGLTLVKELGKMAP